MTRRPAGSTSTSLAVLACTACVLAAAASWAVLAGEGEVALDLAATSAAVALLAVVGAAGRQPPDLEVQVGDGKLTVRFHGCDVVWCLLREMRVPLDRVESVAVHPAGSLWSGWWHRRLGTVVPGIIKAGWFAGADGRELWDVRAGADVLDVRLAAPCRTSRLVLQVPDATTAARTLTAAVRAAEPRDGHQVTATRTRVLAARKEEASWTLARCSSSTRAPRP